MKSLLRYRLSGGQARRAGKPSVGLMRPLVAATLADDFISNLQSLWTDSGDPLPSVSQGALSLSARPSYPQRQSRYYYNLINSSIRFRVLRRPEVSDGAPEGMIRVGPDGGDYLSIVVKGNQLIFRHRDNNVNSDTTAAYNSAHIYWRLRIVQATAYWETSTDGTTWTVRRSKTLTNVSLYEACRVTFRAGTNGSISSDPGKFTIDLLNKTAGSTSMQPPSGFALYRDLTRASSWESELGGFLTEPGEVGPGGDPVLRSTLVDGQTGASSGGEGNPNASERNDLQAGVVPLGSTRYVVWYERFVEMPDTTLDSFQLITPAEIHGHTLPQATVMMHVFANKHRIFNANAGRSTPRYVDLGPIVIDEWVQYMLGVKYSTGNDGWIKLYRNGVEVASFMNEPTTTENMGGYWKFGHYRNDQINGRSIYDVSGVRQFSPGGVA